MYKLEYFKLCISKINSENFYVNKFYVINKIYNDFKSLHK